MGLIMVWRGSFTFPIGLKKHTEVRESDDLPRDYLEWRENGTQAAEAFL